MGAALPPTDSPSRRLLWVILAGIGGLLVIALVVVLVVWRGGAGTPSADGDATAPRPTPSASVAPVPAASAPTPTTPAGPHPTSCDAIYSPAMLSTFSESRTLNPEWTKGSDAVLQVGSTDEELITLMKGTEHLTCIWASEGGGSDSGLTTNVAFVTAEQSEAAHQRLLALGQNCYEELEGIRCVMESAGGPDGAAGESHFFRDGIWLATHYVNAGPDGYTHDMVSTIWPTA